MNTRAYPTTLACTTALCLAASTVAQASTKKLFPTDLPALCWQEFWAEGFAKPVNGVIFRPDRPPCCGVPLGGIGTGCLDVDARGVFGFNALFNITYTENAFSGARGNVFKTELTRKLPDYPPFLGLAAGGHTWVLASRAILDGGTIPTCVDPVFIARTESITLPQVSGVRCAQDIHYWGHYPVVDLEYDLEPASTGASAPVSVGLRAWSPFLPGDSDASSAPCALFEVCVRNEIGALQVGTLAFSFPGPVPTDATKPPDFTRRTVETELMRGVEVSDGMHSYFLGALSQTSERFGGRLGRSGEAWAAIADRLPAASPKEPGASMAVPFSLDPKEAKTFTFVLAWYAPQWRGADEHRYTAMYARRFANPRAVADRVVPRRKELLRRVLAWQEEIYADKQLPAWLRDTLVNNLALLPESTYWAQAKPPLGDWCYQGGFFGMLESPRGCPQIECIPCTWYGNLPIVYFFPELARSTLVAYRHFMRTDGAVPFVIGRWGRPDMATPGWDWQITLNGPCYVQLVDRLWRRTGDNELLREFYPSIKQNLTMTMNLRPTPEGVISMPADNRGMEWFEWGEWLGMCAHAGGLRLATVRVAERMAQAMQDPAFAEQCRRWFAHGSAAMEQKLWANGYYLNFYEEETGRKSEAVMGYQLDGEWAARLHGVGGVFRSDRVAVVLDTLQRCNMQSVKCGALNFATRDGRPLSSDNKIAEYGSHAMFFPEVMMLGMTYIYAGQREFGTELLRKAMEEIVCHQRHPWDLPNMILGDTGQRHYGTDYYQNLMLWASPAALAGQDLTGPVKPGDLVKRVLEAARP